jgi:RNA polymerase sigma-70 factor (ECF subfamily)
MLASRERRALPMDFGPASPHTALPDVIHPEATWIQPIPDSAVIDANGDPAEVAQSRETLKLAFIAALQHLPPRQRAVLLLCEVLRWQATEVAELLETTVASVNSALQRARATLEASTFGPETTEGDLDAEAKALLSRYVDAFERYDMESLTSLIHEDATQSMPPYELWLAGRNDILGWWFGMGIGCQGSKVLPVESANGSPAFAQYKPDPDGGYTPWALQVLELSGDRVGQFTFFLETETLFPLFGLPARLES